MAPQIEVVVTEQRSSFSKLQEERVASRCIKPKVVTAKSVHVLEREALGARAHHGNAQTVFNGAVNCAVQLVPFPLVQRIWCPVVAVECKPNVVASVTRRRVRL